MPFTLKRASKSSRLASWNIINDSRRSSEEMEEAVEYMMMPIFSATESKISPAIIMIQQVMDDEYMSDDYCKVNLFTLNLSKSKKSILAQLIESASFQMVAGYGYRITMSRKYCEETKRVSK